MVTLGGDSHKRSHTLVAVDGNGRRLGELTVAANAAGHREALAWSQQWPERRWALENCRHLSRALERDLVAAGEAVLQVSPEPEFVVGPRSLVRTKVLNEVGRRLEGRPGVQAEIARELVGRLVELTKIVNQLQRRIEAMARDFAPSLLRLPGCAGLTAAKLVAESGDIRRFHSSAAFAKHNGTAPIPVWSGNQERHRLNRSGNRQLNAALHRIAITQLRLGGRRKPLSLGGCLWATPRGRRCELCGAICQTRSTGASSTTVAMP